MISCSHKSKVRGCAELCLRACVFLPNIWWCTSEESSLAGDLRRLAVHCHALCLIGFQVSRVIMRV